MQLAGASSNVGACFGVLSWSATTAGNDQSVLSGVLAGFVFAGIVAVLGVRTADHAREAASALKLMFCAFIGLAVAAYLLADQAADTECTRASAEETLAGGILGTFAIIMIASLTWLISAYNLHQHRVLRFLRRLLYVAGIFVVLLLCTSSYSYMQDDLRQGVSFFGGGFWLYVTGALIYGVAHPVTLRVPRRFFSWMRKKGIGRRHKLTQGRDDGREMLTVVDFCAMAALVYLAAAAIGDAYVISTLDAQWVSPSANGVRWVAWASLVIPLMILMWAMNALAPDIPAPDKKQAVTDPFTEPQTEKVAIPYTLRQASIEMPTHKRQAEVIYAFAGLAAALVAAYGLIHKIRRRLG